MSFGIFTVSLARRNCFPTFSLQNWFLIEIEVWAIPIWWCYACLRFNQGVCGGRGIRSGVVWCHFWQRIDEEGKIQWNFRTCKSSHFWGVAVHKVRHIWQCIADLWPRMWSTYPLASHCAIWSSPVEHISGPNTANEMEINEYRPFEEEVIPSPKYSHIEVVLLCACNSAAKLCSMNKDLHC